MDPLTRQHQEIADSSLENMSVNSKGQQERKPRPQHHDQEAVKCPRCDSTNTKFCYYNNYSLSQPRYFCKSCRRYWTKGGTLRNVPVGGGCRKNKRSSSSKRSQDPPLTPITTATRTTTTHFPPLNYDANDDLSLAFSRLQKQPSFALGFDDIGNPSFNSSPVIVDALKSSFLGNHNFYYGFGDENNMGFNGELMVPYSTDEMKQELISMADFESGRGSWNGFNSTWHGLLNSPLM